MKYKNPNSLYSLSLQRVCLLKIETTNNLPQVILHDLN